MRPRSPARARFLGLWTAGWLAVLLVLGMVRFGDPALQWPVLVVPAIWALVALRPRRATRTGGRRPPAPDGDAWPGHPGDDDRGARGEPGAGGGGAWTDGAWTDEAWTDEGWTDEHPRVIPPAERTDTVERPALRRRSDGESNRR
ncbi:hypothetical protein [Blastococcus xanthinilyticus]|uniref:Uncharacterized protein n=1 Tax=Blastococcus xanthinilyticus TaxID=1564164 RepID=A0A5S5CQW1_9ACTN|nr:hypothetical protein [Blastococcus xanthinilyticus]TYP86271.1 hypothetical protein BD833_110162 [Blastococcus xanthinilyticus]